MRACEYTCFESACFFTSYAKKFRLMINKLILNFRPSAPPLLSDRNHSNRVSTSSSNASHSSNGINGGNLRHSSSKALGGTVDIERNDSGLGSETSRVQVVSRSSASASAGHRGRGATTVVAVGGQIRGSSGER